MQINRASSLTLSTLVFFGALGHPIDAVEIDDIRLIKERLIEDALVKEGFIDRTRRFSAADASQTPSYLASLQSDGSWPDIDYQDRDNDWSPMDHVGRALAITLAYARPGSPHYQDSETLAQLLSCLNYWYQVNPTCVNWYKNDIGKQFFLQQIGLLLADRLPEELLSNIIEDLTASPSMGGVNMTWLAVSTIYRGVLENSPERIKTGVDAFTKQVAFNERYEGLKPDYSYQQHGRHLYNGMYGTSFLSDTTRIGSILRGTCFALSHEQVALLRNYYLQSMRWSIRGHLQDYNVRGRQVGRSAGQDMQAYELVKPLDYLSLLDPEYEDQYQESKRAIEQGIPQPIDGNRHFWWADFTVHHRPEYMVSLKMCSERTIGVEIDVNKENLLGYWLPYGLTYFYRDGREYEDIFPAWDWGRLPGVTSPHEEFAIKKGRYTQQTAFVGAVSDGRYGVSSMHLNAQETEAKKSWFFFDDELAALGAGINSTNSAPIVTGVNQAILRSETLVDGQVYREGDATGDSPAWVWHDGVGYLFPQKQSVAVKAGQQSGKFRRIYGLADDVVVTKDVFSIWLKHGSQPKDASYSYIVIPATSSAALDKRSRNSGIEILSNTESLQAVAHDQLQLTGAVFHQPDTLAFTELFNVHASAPSIILFDQKSGKLHVSDPTQTLTNITISVESPLHSEFKCTVELPSGKKAGTSVAIDVPDWLNR